MEIEALSLIDAVEKLNTFKRWQPYRFGGKWYVMFFENKAYLYRNIQSVKNKARTLGLSQIEYLRIN